MGGREIHPISAAVGGFYKVPSKKQLAPIVEDLQWALEAAVATAKLVATFDFPDFEQDYEFVALSHPDEYAFNEGRVVSNKGLDIDISEYEDHFREQHVKHANALHSQVRARGSYFVGPLARFNLNFDKLPEIAQQTARECGLSVPCLNPFKSIVVRAVELVFACAEALRVIEAYEPPAAPRVEAKARAGVGQAVTEAPRGILYHRYSIDPQGLILSARIVPPTSQNQKRIEDDLWRFVPQLLDKPHRGDHVAMRAGDSELRPLHLVRDAFPEADRLSAIIRSSEACRQPGVEHGPRRGTQWAVRYKSSDEDPQ